MLNLDFNLNSRSRQIAFKKSKYADRFIPFHGSERDQEISRYLLSSRIDFKSHCFNAYRKALAETCFDMSVPVLKKRTVFLRGPQERLDRSPLAAYKKTTPDEIRTQAPLLIDQFEIPEGNRDYYANNLAVYGEHKVVLASGNVLLTRDVCLKDSPGSSMEFQLGSSAVSSVCWTESGRYILAGEAAGYVDRIDTETKTCAHSITLDEAQVYSVVSLNESSPIALAGTGNGYLYKLDWRTADGIVAEWFSSPDKVCGISISPDERYFLAGDNSNAVCLWDINGGDMTPPCSILRGHAAAVKAISWHHSLPLVCTGGGGSDATIKIWNLKNVTEPEMITSTKVEAQVTSLQWTSGRLIATYGYVWNYTGSLETFRVNGDFSLTAEHQVPGHQRRILSSALSHSHDVLYTLGEDPFLKVWDISRSLPGAYSRPPIKSKPLTDQFSIR